MSGLRGTPRLSYVKSVNSGGAPLTRALGWQPAQLPFCGLLNSARPRCSCTLRVVRPARNASYLLVNGANSGMSSCWYFCSANSARSNATSGVEKIASPNTCRNSAAYAAWLSLSTTASADAFAISCAARNGRRACSMSEPTRPSRSKPPVGVPSASKKNAGFNVRYLSDGELRKPAVVMPAPAIGTACVGWSPANACDGTWQLAHEVWPLTERDASWKIFSPSRAWAERVTPDAGGGLPEVSGGTAFPSPPPQATKNREAAIEAPTDNRFDDM